MSLSVNNFVDVTVNLSSVAVTTAAYDVGLLLIEKTNWPAGISTRTQVVTSTADATSKGFNSSVTGAIAKYFSQTPTPTKLVCGYYDATMSEGVPTETPAVGLAACRTANTEWYIAASYEVLTATEVAAVAAAVEAFVTPSYYFYITKDANCITSETSNIMATLKTANYKRTLGFYVDNTQATADTSMNYTAVAAMGKACGLNTKEDNSAYTLAFKTLSGVGTTNISDSEFSTLKGYNGNVYANVANASFSMIMTGVSASGVFYDEIYCLDVLKNQIETNVMNLFSSTRVVPQTDSGVSMITSRVTDACDLLVRMGFIAPGIWNGSAVKTLETGDALTSGYIVMHDSIAEQTAAEREARIAPTIYVCIKLAGAVNSVAVVVNVNR